MADKLFNLTIITPKEITYQGRVSSIIIPAESGYLGVLVDHAPLVANTKPGKIVFKDETQKTETIDLKSTGFLEVLGNKVTLLVR